MNLQPIYQRNNLHEDYSELLEKNKLHEKAATYISNLDIDAEQLWILRYYTENGVLPTIKQAQEIWEVHGKRKLTLKAFRGIMASSLVPKKIVFNFDDLAPFFDKYKSPEEIKQDVLHVLTNWKNKRSS
jgi:hypothetical protein